MARENEQTIEGPWELPDGWKWKRLRDVTQKPERGIPSSRFDGQFRYLDVSSIEGSRITPKTISTAGAPSRARQFVQPGDTVLSGVRVYLRNLAQIQEGGPDVVSTAFSVLRPGAELHALYLYQWIGSDHFINFLLPLQRGNSPPAVLDDDVREQLIPLPPTINEQVRIASRIDELLTDVGDGERELVEAWDGVETYREALLQAAVTGELTVDWRRDNLSRETGADLLRRILAERRVRWEADSQKTYVEPVLSGANGLSPLPRGWAWAPFDAVLQTLSDSGLKTKERDYLRSGRYPIIDQGAKPIGGFTDNPNMVQSHELPVIIFGDHTRRFKFVDFEFGIGADGVKMMKPEPLMSARFLFRALQAARFEDRGYSRHYQFVRALAFPVPSMREQDEIVQVLDRCFAEIDAMNDVLDDSSAEVQSLRQSILAAAFRGDITS